MVTLNYSLIVNRDELIDEEFLFGGMKLTAKEQAEYRLVSFIFQSYSQLCPYNMEMCYKLELVVDTVLPYVLL